METDAAAPADEHHGPEAARAAFVPPDAAASFYVGTVMHARLQPMQHRFSYRVASVLLDIDRLDEAGGTARLFSVNRRNVVSFREADHGPEAPDGTRDGPLKARIRQLLTDHAIEADRSRILLLCYPRMLGYVFNPLSVYFVYGPGGALDAVVYEVRNTFGGLHCYVEPVAPGQMSEAGIRQARAKGFYVSPFIGESADYRFRVRPPTDEVRLRILETDPNGPVLSATFAGTRRPMTDAAILALLGRIPLMTQKVIGGIHFEALRLWLKGARYHPPPADGHVYRP